MEEKYNEYWERSNPEWIKHIHDRPEAQAFREYVLDQTLFELIGDVKSRSVLDIGCGEGYYCRKLAEKGATKVIGIDFSIIMLEYAKNEEKKNPYGITYLNRDATMLEKMDYEFDIIYSNLVLNIIPHYSQVLSIIPQNLSKNGAFIFIIPHPSFDGVGSGWVEVGQNERRWSANRYIDLVSGTAIHGAPTFHRPLSHYIRMCFNQGLVLTDFKETIPPEEYSKMLAPRARLYDRIPPLVGMRFEFKK